MSIVKEKVLKKFLHSTESCAELAIKILKNEGKPMRIREITRKILEIRQLKSKTPASTVSAMLQRSSAFKRVGLGTYYLNEEFKNS